MAYKEYNTSYLWMLGAVLLLAYNTHWPIKKSSWENRDIYFNMAIALLTVGYFTIRYLTKRERHISRKKKAQE
ncbi:hypothetical protein [Pricia sp.]|uniref:hypothetical protein n=1 Tax=Pricia sp. TaxID=2268138 RepID=UPI003593AC5F